MRNTIILSDYLSTQCLSLVENRRKATEILSQSSNFMVVGTIETEPTVLYVIKPGVFNSSALLADSMVLSETMRDIISDAFLDLTAIRKKLNKPFSLNPFSPMRIAKNGQTVSDTICTLDAINHRFAGEKETIGMVRCEIKADFSCEEGDILEIFISGDELASLQEKHDKKSQL